VDVLQAVVGCYNINSDTCQ